jgi:hypothetical protein
MAEASEQRGEMVADDTHEALGDAVMEHLRLHEVKQLVDSALRENTQLIQSAESMYLMLNAIVPKVHHMMELSKTPKSHNWQAILEPAEALLVSTRKILEIIRGTPID